MKMSAVFALILTFSLFPAETFAQTVKASASLAKKNSTPATTSTVNPNDQEAAEPLPTWPEQKARLKKIEAKFRDKKLSKEDKVKFLPESNMLLSEMQDIKFAAGEKADQIATTISFISASIDSDFANSNTDTVYFDYKANQKAYDAEIAKLPKDSAKKINQAFKEWAEFEKESAKPQSESDEE